MLNKSHRVDTGSWMRFWAFDEGKVPGYSLYRKYDSEGHGVPTKQEFPSIHWLRLRYAAFVATKGFLPDDLAYQQAYPYNIKEVPPDLWQTGVN